MRCGQEMKLAIYIVMLAVNWNTKVHNLLSRVHNI